MLSIFKVYSADWETEVVAESATDAVLIGTREQYMHLGVNFNIGFAIVAQEVRTKNYEFFCPAAILQDLGYHKLSIEVSRLFKALRP